jgi:hypothetical protein
MDSLETSIPVPKGWVANTMEKQIKSSMAAVIASASSKFDRRKGTFDLLGFDFMVGSNGQLCLIEVNTNPALHVSDGKVLEDLLPKLVAGTLDIVLETNGQEESDDSATKARSNFQLIYNEMDKYKYMTNEQKLMAAEIKSSQQNDRLIKLSKMLAIASSSL